MGRSDARRLSGYPAIRAALAERTENAKRAFDLSVVADFTSAGADYLDWYSALAEEYVAALDAHRGSQILDRAGFREPNGPPVLSFSTEVDRALISAGWQAFDTLTRAATARRTAIFDGLDGEETT